MKPWKYTLKIKHIVNDEALSPQEKGKMIVPKLWGLIDELNCPVADDTLLNLIMDLSLIGDATSWGTGIGKIGSNICPSEQLESCLWTLCYWCKKNNVEVI